MKTTKQILAVLLVLLVSVGAVCAQICDISCIGQSGQVAAAPEAQQHTSPSGHCHKKSPESASQEQPSPQQQPNPQKDHSSDCQSHNYAVESVKSGKNAVADASQKGDSPVADLFPLLDVSFAHLVNDHARGRPDRSPPPPQIHSILRI